MDFQQAFLDPTQIYVRSSDGELVHPNSLACMTLLGLKECQVRIRGRTLELYGEKSIGYKIGDQVVYSTPSGLPGGFTEADPASRLLSEAYGIAQKFSDEYYSDGAGI